MITAGRRLIWNLIGISVMMMEIFQFLLVFWSLIFLKVFLLWQVEPFLLSGDIKASSNLLLFWNHKSFRRYSATSKLLTELLVWRVQQSGSSEHINT